MRQRKRVKCWHLKNEKEKQVSGQTRLNFVQNNNQQKTFSFE